MRATGVIAIGTDAIRTVLVIGGGVAGIAASAALADAGMQVTLVEKRPLLGGRASSHRLAATGELVDECQHGTMRCCTNLTDLLTRFGVNDKIDYHDAIHFLDSEGKRSVIKGCGMPAPGHTGLSFLLFRSLSVADKLCIARAMLAMVMRPQMPDADSRTMASWFAEMKQTERAIKRFWAPVLISACNESIDRISCFHAFKIFRDGFLMNHEAFHFGVPTVPLAELYHSPAINYIQKRGGVVLPKTTVDRVLVSDEQQVSGIVLQNGDVLNADRYVFALQSDLLLKLLPAELTSDSSFWQPIADIELSPIVGIHLWLDKEIDCPAAIALLDRDTEWVFNKNINYRLPAGSGTNLSALISASQRFTNTPQKEILDMVIKDLRAALPAMQGATVVRSQVVKWPRATFSPVPGIESARPDQRTPVRNLLLAGEWTQTGWPSTMESAVISGYRAAEYILAEAGQPKAVQAKALPYGAVARLLDGYRRK